MARLINKTQTSFTIVNNEILRNKKLGMKERGLLITLISLPDGWNFSVQGLVSILPEGKTAIQAGIHKLEEMGYIRRTLAKEENGHFSGYDWEISDRPIFAEKPLAENQSTVNEMTENPLQLNTKELNTYESNTNSFIPSFEETKTEDFQEVKERERRKERNGLTKEEKEREELKILMGYSEIEKDEIAKDIFEIAVEVCSSENDIIKISKDKWVPVSIFKSRIKKLYYEDIIRIANEIRNVNQPILNPKSYILAALYNESVVTNTYYTNKVKVDFGV